MILSNNYFHSPWGFKQLLYSHNGKLLDLNSKETNLTYTYIQALALESLSAVFLMQNKTKLNEADSVWQEPFEKFQDFFRYSTQTFFWQGLTAARDLRATRATLWCDVFHIWCDVFHILHCFPLVESMHFFSPNRCVTWGCAVPLCAVSNVLRRSCVI